MTTPEFDKLSNDDLYFKIGLYHKIEINTIDYTVEEYKDSNFDPCHEYKWPKEYEKLLDFIFNKNKVYGYCCECSKNLVMNFKDFYSDTDLDSFLKENKLSKVLTHCDCSDDFRDIEGNTNSVMSNNISTLISYKKYFSKKVVCSMDARHEYHFSFMLDYNGSNLYLMKIGQYPSVSDFYFSDCKAEEKTLKSLGLLGDYRMGCYAFAHGFGSGSYAYMRRVFEKIIISTFEENATKIGISIEEFKKMRMNEKIEKLKNYLPLFLTNNKNLYPILSAGIHLLPEDSCKEFFPIIKDCIDLIAQDLNAKKEKEKIEKEANATLGKIQEKVKQLMSNPEVLE